MDQASQSTLRMAPNIGAVRASAIIPSPHAITPDLQRIKKASQPELPAGESIMACYDVAGRIIWCSEGLAKWLDRPVVSAGEPKTVESFFGEPAWAALAPLVQQVVSTGSAATYARLKAVNGEREQWVRVQLLPWVAPDGTVQGVIDCELSDQSRDFDIQAAQAHERRIEMLVNNTPHPMTYFDLNLRYVYVNNVFLERIGFTREEVLGHTIQEVREPEAVELFTPFLARALEGERGILEWRPTFRGGLKRWVRTEFFPDLDAQGKVKGIYVMATDIHDLKLAHDRVRAMANTDALTGLPNRPALREELESRLASHTPSSKPFAVLFIDLDGFKAINDTHGHRYGDSVLIRVAAALESVMREQDVIGRLAGDEFMALLNNTGRAEARRVSGRILEQMQRIDMVDGIAVSVSASVGIAIFPEDGSDFDALFRASDQAMYRAKQQGKNQVWDVKQALK